MTISDAERRERQKYIGASDVSALFGYNLFARPLDVYKSKVEPLGEDSTGRATWIGNHLEPAIITMLEDKLECYINQPETAIHANQILAANLDGQVTSYKWGSKAQEEPAVIECKSEGFTGEPPGRTEKNDWGRGGSGNVPEKVMLQTQAQMACTGYNHAIIGLLDGYRGKGLRVYRVKRNDKLIRQIILTVEYFWKTYILTKTPSPEDMVYVRPK